MVQDLGLPSSDETGPEEIQEAFAVGYWTNTPDE